MRHLARNWSSAPPGASGDGQFESLAAFPWAPSTRLTFTAQGEYPLAFPPECPLRLLFFQFSVAHRVTPSFHDYPELSLVCVGKGRFTVERRVYEVAEGDYPLAVRTCLTDILFEVSRHCRSSVGELAPPNQQAREFDRLLGVFSFIRKNCHERISLEVLARMAHMSSGYFCRFFKATTGETPTEYILRLRIDLSADLLSNSAMSVTDVAYAAGFSSHSYFDRVFKRLERHDTLGLPATPENLSPAQAKLLRHPQERSDKSSTPGRN